MFEVTKEEVERLDPLSLTRLMKRLLRAELSKLKLKQSELIVSLDINDPDGGLDGYIGCGICQDHPWLPSGRSGWQFKALRNFPRSRAEEEVLNEDKTEVKPRIKKLLREGETYVLVIGGKDYNKDKLEEKEKEIIEIFDSKGLPESKVKVYSSGQIADWINSFPSVVTHLKPDRANFKDIEEWRERTRAIKEPREFVSDEKRESTMESIRETIISNHNRERATIIRLVGFQGVGKTRLIYEALNTKELKELVLYTESPNKLPISRFNEIARNENITSIFVVDECPHEEYVQLAKEAEGIGGRMILITLDYDKDRPRDSRDMHIVLEPLDKNASDKLIQLTVPSLPEMARRKIVDFSEGYPRIAVLLSENFSSHPDVLSPGALSRIDMSDLFDRIVAGRYSEGSAIFEIKKALTMIALFRRLGWDDEVAIQGKKACELFGIDLMGARGIVKEQEDRGLVTRRGRYRYVTPLPLAIYLASSWWEAMDKPGWVEFFKELPDLEIKMAFLDRLKDLPQSEHAKIALKDIFSGFKYELLDNPNGSEIFLGLAKADHLSAMETLERILGHLSREKLLQFKAGRRNVVWSLEKIAWWQDTFSRAARLLLKLADAENETWSNNATGVFAQLFQTFLGGTTVPAWERHIIIEEALNSGDKSLQKLALKGLNAAFNLMHATRDMSGEEQGAVIPPPEWNPKSRQDLTKSVLSALNILDKAVKLADPRIQTEATRVFLSHVRILFKYGFTDEVMERLHLIQSHFPELDKEVIKTVESVIHYDDKKLPEEVINVVRKFRDELVGDDFNGLMKRYVKSKLLEDELKENKEKVERIVRKLVEESIESPEKLKDELNWLVTNEAENGYMFGKLLGELDKGYYWLDIILRAIKESEDPSVYFLGGYLSSIKSRDEKLWEKILNKCYSDEILKKFLLEIIWRSGTSDKAVEMIVGMLKNKEIKPQEIILFTYGAWFTKVSAQRFVYFLEEYYKIEDGKYAPSVLAIISQYVDAHSHIIGDAKDTLLKYLTKTNIFENPDTMTMYHWSKLSNNLTAKFSDTVPYFVDLVLQTLRKKNHVYLDRYLREELKHFLERDFENAWKNMKVALLANDLRAWKLMHIFRGDFSGFEAKKDSLLGLVPEKYLWEWVEENPNKAPYILARMIPLHESEPLLHPIARKLLIKYPNNEQVESTLSANWHTEGFSGSTSVHYTKKLSIAGKWAEDPETSVASWANKEVKYLKRQIENSKRKEEERRF